MPNRIRELREAMGWSQPDLARAIKPPTTPQQVGRLEKDERGLTQAWMERIARALDCSPSDLLPDSGEFKKATKPQVPLVGYVGAGELYYPDPASGPWAGFDWVDAPPGETDVIAVRVRGDSMSPVYRDGDLIFFRRTDHNDPQNLMGKDCIVQVRNGAAYIKTLAKGTRANRYKLKSFATADVIDNVDIEWLAPVMWVKRL